MSEIIDLKTERIRRVGEDEKDILWGVFLAGARAMTCEFGKQSVIDALLCAAETLKNETPE